jgi:hypothetical protein
MWSRTLTLIVLQASFIFLVMSMSACDGTHTPDGWLWANIIAAALCSNTFCIITLGYTAAESIVPLNNVSVHRNFTKRQTFNEYD